MNQQDVIKAFVDKLANHGYAYSDDVGTKMLDSAVRASSRFTTIQEVIDAMKADQTSAEKLAVQEVLGNDYADKTLAEVQADVLSADAKTHDGAKAVGNAFLENFTPNADITVEDVIKERKAYIFLENYCGIQLPTRYWLTQGDYTFYGDSVTDSQGNLLSSTGKVDTGAITGSDAGATSTPKTDRSVVPEEFNTYTANSVAAQIISTDNRAWVVNSTSYHDTITALGADYISAGAGDDKITVNLSGATLISGSGKTSFLRG